MATVLNAPESQSGPEFCRKPILEIRRRIGQIYVCRAQKNRSLMKILLRFLFSFFTSLAYYTGFMCMLCVDGVTSLNTA